MKDLTEIIESVELRIDFRGHDIEKLEPSPRTTALESEVKFLCKILHDLKALDWGNLRQKLKEKDDE